MILSLKNRIVISEGPNAFVDIVKGLSLERALEGVKRAFIKPNLRAAAVQDYAKGSITSIDVIEMVVDFLTERGISVSIGECTSSRLITEKAIQNSGVLRLETRTRILNLNLEPTERLDASDHPLGFLEIPKAVLQSDFLISLPVMKTHSITTVSLGLKNMMGSAGEFMPVRFHLKGLDSSIAYTNLRVKPKLVIVDAIWAMEGTGPVLGIPKKLDTLIGGYDPVAVDAVCTQMMGYNPQMIGHIVMAEKFGLGELSGYEILGDKKVYDFQPSRHSLLVDYYDYKVFNLIMNIRPVHNFFYNTAYVFVKKILRLISPSESGARARSDS